MSIDKTRYGASLYKLIRICKEILPSYNKHIYNIITNFNENTQYADTSSALGFENVDDISREISELLLLHSGYNRNTLHGETKASLGLGLIENLRLASEEDAILGTSNDLYLTPYMAGVSVDVNATAPLNAHISSTSNPHGETAEAIGSLSRNTIVTQANEKYLKTERVTNALSAVYNGNKTYETLLTEFRTGLPPANFTSGLIDPRRVASGTPSATSVVMSDNRTWTTIASLANDPQYAGRMIAAASFNDTFTAATALNFIRTNQPYVNLPQGSIVLFTVTETLGTAQHTWNNGHSGTVNKSVGVGHVAIKYSNTDWQVV